MPPVTEANIERYRARLLALISILLLSFAAVSVGFSFWPEVLETLHLTPTAARLGVLVLAASFVMLVWEKENQFRGLSDELRSHVLLAAAFRNRLDVLEGLIDAGDRLNAPLTIKEVLNVLLQAAMDLSGAVGGSVALLSEEGTEIEMTESRLPSVSGAELPETQEITIPLRNEHALVARLTLLIPVDDLRSEMMGLDVLDRFAEQAAQTLVRTRAMEHDRASFAYLQATHVVKSRFLATVSHELRTPLTSIIGFTSTLENHWERLDEAQKREALASINRQSHRLWRLVERILEAARVELEGVAVRPVEHDLIKSMRSAVQPFLDTDEAGRLYLDLPPSPTIAEIDPVILEQCLWNVVDNALRYTEGKVTVRLIAEGDVVHVAIHDHGKAMDPSRLRETIDPLARIGEDPRSGTGLGLHVVHTLISDHGGSVSFDNDGFGTTVTLNFPRWARLARQTRDLRDHSDPEKEIAADLKREPAGDYEREPARDYEREPAGNWEREPAGNGNNHS